MSKEFLKYALMFVILVVAQVLVFNHLCLWGYAIPLVFIYFIIKLPVTLNLNWVITLSFLLGLSVDIFSNTPGMNALACTLLSVLKLPVMHLYYPRDEDMTNPEPSMRTLGVGSYLKYSFSVTFVYCLMFFLFESFTFYAWLPMIGRTFASTAVTFLIILAIDSFQARRR